jgi:hypothetical protein
MVNQEEASNKLDLPYLKKKTKTLTIVVNVFRV